MTVEIHSFMQNLFELSYGDGVYVPGGKLTGEALQEFNCDSAGTSLD